MSCWNSFGTVIRRVEFRLGLQVTAVGALLVTIVLGYLYLFAAEELLEEEGRTLEHILKSIQAEASKEGHDPLAVVHAHIPVLARRDLSFQLHDAGNHPVAAWGMGPTPENGLIPMEHDVLAAIRAHPRDFLVAEISLQGGYTLTAMISLDHFVDERRELRGRAGISLAIGLLFSLGAAVLLVPRALQPLRDATLAVERVDETNLSVRVPTRASQDIVDRHAAAVNKVLTRLEWAFQRMRGFGADAAHELRTPINRILAVVDVATDSGIEQQQMALDSIRITTEEMRRLLDSLFLLAQGEEGRLGVHRTRVDMSELLESLDEIYRPLCEDNSIVLERNSLSASVDGDRELLARGIANLIENAIRHTPAGGTIRIEAKREGPDLAITVSDSGPGIPASERERVFERFVQLDGSRSGTESGLGLPISRMIARIHGGDVTLEASQLGGAAFVMRLNSEQ